MSPDLRTLILLGLGGMSLALYLVSLAIACARPWIARLATPLTDLDRLMWERSTALRWFERGGSWSFWKSLAVVAPITIVGLGLLIRSMGTDLDEANSAMTRDILRYGSDSVDDSEVDGAATAVAGMIVISPLLLIPWIGFNMMAYEAVRATYGWAAESGRRVHVAVGLLISIFGVLLPALIALLAIVLRAENWIWGLAGLVSPGLLLVVAKLELSRCVICSLALVPAGLTAPVFAALMVSVLSALRGALQLLVRLIPKPREGTLRVIACHFAFLFGIEAAFSLHPKAWLMIGAGLVLELLGLPGLMQAVLGTERTSRHAAWLAQLCPALSAKTHRVVGLMRSRVGVALCLPGLSLSLAWVFAHPSDPMPIFATSETSTVIHEFLWTPVVGIWILAIVVYVCLLLALLWSRIAPVFVAAPPRGRLKWIGAAALFSLGILLQGFGIASFSA